MQSGVPNEQLSNRRKRIVINIDKHTRRTRQSNDQSESMFNPNKQLPKLFDISDRCFQYYDKFKEDRLEQEQYMELMFNQLLKYLEGSFKDLVQIINQKQAQLRKCVLEKKNQFSSFHPTHFLSLTQKVEIIKQQKLYLQKLNLQQTNNFIINFNSEGQPKQNQYYEFTKQLNAFYNEVEAIEKVNFKENIKSSTMFLRNLIKDQTQFYMKRIGDDANSTPHDNISFNNQQLFSVKSFHEDISHGAWEEFKANAEKTQRDLDTKIDHYSRKLKVF